VLSSGGENRKVLRSRGEETGIADDAESKLYQELPARNDVLDMDNGHWTRGSDVMA